MCRRYDSWSYLNKLCNDGLAERYGDDDQPAGRPGQTLRERLDYELGVIKRMGYVDYFLIVWDFINFAKTGFRWDRGGVPLREVSWRTS